MPAETAWVWPPGPGSTRTQSAANRVRTSGLVASNSVRAGARVGTVTSGPLGHQGGEVVGEGAVVTDSESSSAEAPVSFVTVERLDRVCSFCFSGQESIGLGPQGLQGKVEQSVVNFFCLKGCKLLGSFGGTFRLSTVLFLISIKLEGESLSMLEESTDRAESVSSGVLGTQEMTQVPALVWRTVTKEGSPGDCNPVSRGSVVRSITDEVSVLVPGEIAVSGSGAGNGDGGVFSNTGRNCVSGSEGGSASGDTNTSDMRIKSALGITVDSSVSHLGGNRKI